MTVKTMQSRLMVQLPNVEDGQTVTVNIDGTDYTTTVTGNAWSITGIDLSII